MITLVLTNRNRDLRIVTNCLDSLEQQSNRNFELIFVDYGSDLEYTLELEKLISKYHKIQYISCPVWGQLWNKSRAINIALQKSSTPYFMVGDIDLIFAPDFINIVTGLVKDDEVHYFQYGFLSKEESLMDKKYDDYLVDFKGNNEVTGTTVFPSAVLKNLNGYDEFYHGWGAEDTDIHIRMRNLGLKVNFFDKKILVKHQWHPKQYRSKSSEHPFHSLLERINHSYMVLTNKTKRTIVNQNTEWGKIAMIDQYEKLKNHSTRELIIRNSQIEVHSLFAQLRNFKDEVVEVKINEISDRIRRKNSVKKIFKKKYISFLRMNDVNNLLLEEIIKNYRNLPYQYSFDRNKNAIHLKIYFS